MSKKALLLLAYFVSFVSLFCACQVQPDRDNTHLTIDASTEYTQEGSGESTPVTEAAPEPAVPEWKSAYLELLESKKDSHLSYALVYIDGDDIPELYLSGNCAATGDGICSYKNGNVVEQRLNRIGGGRYIAGSGDIINQNGNMGHCYTHVYRLTEEGFALTFHALSAERMEDFGNGEYHLSYEYFIGDTPVSESDYNAAVDAAFDFAQSVQLDENTVAYEVIKQQIIDSE